VAQTDRPAGKRPVRYEACGGVMFGAYSVRVTYDDGSQQQIMHGSPRQCLETAERLDREIRAAQSRLTTSP
jgi:hypothetical protein